MNAFACVVKTGSLIKARRLYMKMRSWGDVSWYARWPEIAEEWEAAATWLAATVRS